MGEDKITVTWDEIQTQQVPPADQLPPGTGETAARAGTLRKRRRLFLVLTVLGVLVVGAGAAGLWFMLWQERPDHAASIKKVLDLDWQAQQECFGQRGNWDDLVDPANGARQYAAALRQIGLAECPNDFVDAYVRHIQAWEKLVLELNDKAGIRGIIRSFVSGLIGDISAGTRMDEDVERCRREVLDSWHQVENIARKYGVNL